MMKEKDNTRVIIILCVFVFCIVFNFQNVISGEESIVKISSLKNDVRVKKADSDEWLEAKQNMPVLMGDSIKTGADSSANLKLSYPKENWFQLYENTEITVAEIIEGKEIPLKMLTVDVLKGGTWTKLKGMEGKDFKFKISTPNTVAAISGTSLATIVYSDHETYFCACDGVIDVGMPGKDVTINKSEGTIVKGEDAPSHPVNDKYILTDTKYRDDPRYGWCIYCHSMMENETAWSKFCNWGVRVGVFPGCCASGCQVPR